ncbi:hypothetical protein [Mangrovicoccus sp. HB161399]|uniref:hypothetical protein n=1 Tax=Mangrovicoccus sp. HB161399 TaxID=2720392 RepID=UPI00155180ED|nr:hypothetical protein [Mangrovicoccus sp. HB161399]
MDLMCQEKLAELLREQQSLIRLFDLEGLAGNSSKLEEILKVESRLPMFSSIELQEISAQAKRNMSLLTSMKRGIKMALIRIEDVSRVCKSQKVYNRRGEDSEICSRGKSGGTTL